MDGENTLAYYIVYLLLIKGIAVDCYYKICLFDPLPNKQPSLDGENALGYGVINWLLS